MFLERLVSFFGIFVLIGIAWLFSTNRKAVKLKIVITGVLFQVVLGFLILWTPPGKFVFEVAKEFITKIISFSDAGATLVFGEGFREHFFAFSVLPTIIFVSSLMSILFYWGWIQKVVQVMATLMMKVMDVSGAESLAASANVFVGQTEAPLVVKPYIASMTNSELMALMTGGMATIAGGVMAAYVSFGADPGHLLAASIMSAPASLLVAKVLVPETEVSKTKGVVKIDIPIDDANVLDAACRGASEGLKLALNVGAMLIAFVALAALINYGLSFIPLIAGAPLTVERILGWAFAPIAWVIGVPSQDISAVGSLLGKKMFLNEFVAYLDLKEMKGVISDRSFIISTYALCGFANFSSIAIQIGGIGSLVPERRKDLAIYGLRAMIGGTIAALMTATIAGILI